MLLCGCQSMERELSGGVRVIGGCAGEMRPPLTVVLINNAGGGIFSFLPIAEKLPADTFSQLWATPQNVDLAGVGPHMALP